MKFLFVETKYKDLIVIPDHVIAKLPKTCGLFTTVQFINSLPAIVQQLEQSGRKVVLQKGKHTKYIGQIYGCNLEKFEGVNEFFYLGDGLFHPKALILGNAKKVHTYNPITGEYMVFGRKLMLKEQNRQKAAYSKFMTSRNIGVIISTKPGQSYFRYAQKLEKMYHDKNFYYIVFDTVDFEALQDFNFIDVWVNTACPRVGWDDTKRVGKPMLDLGTVL